MVCEEEEEGRRRELPVLWKVVKVTFLVSGLRCSSLSLYRDTVSRLVRAGRDGLTEEVWEVSALFLQVALSITRKVSHQVALSITR